MSPVRWIEIYPCRCVDDTTNGARFPGMSASKTKSDLLRTVTVQSSETVHHLCPTSFRIRKNGIEFKSQSEISLWTEMTVDLQLPGTKSFACSGVVVACQG